MSGGVNFGFLSQHDPRLLQLAQRAERYFPDDPNTCLIKLRQFGELLVAHVAAHFNLPEGENFASTIGRLKREGVNQTVITGFHELRLAGNDAVHGFGGDHREALHKLKIARGAAVWFHRVTKQRDFDPGPFVPPSAVPQVAAEIEQLQQQLQQALLETERAKNLAESEAQQRAAAELKALQLAQQQPLPPEDQEEVSQTLLANARAQAEQAPEQVQQVKNQAAAQLLPLDEADTRILIDRQLREAGWEVDSARLTHAGGERPEKGKSRAIAEWPTGNGIADYVLFLGLTPVAVVEAKRKNKDVCASLEQSKRYSRAFPESHPQGPWQDYSWRSPSALSPVESRRLYPAPCGPGDTCPGAQAPR